MEKMELNENDHKLLAYCNNQPRFISDIARNIGIDVKNVSVRIDKLKKANMINIDFIGNKKYVRTKNSIKVDFYLKKILEELSKLGGNLSQEDFDKLVTDTIDYSSLNNLEKSDFYDKISAKWLAIKEGFVEQRIQLTERGKRLLNKK